MLTTRQIGGIVEEVLEGRPYSLNFDVTSNGNPITAYLCIESNTRSTIINIRFDIVGSDSPDISFLFGGIFVPLCEIDYITSLAESIATRIDSLITEAEFEDWKRENAQI